jgi:dihydrophenazinedicarboxylate synthase
MRGIERERPVAAAAQRIGQTALDPPGGDPGDEIGELAEAARGQAGKHVVLGVPARAAGTFHWPDRLQQINVAGQVERTDEAESDALFLERPAEARASAIASRQSEVLDDEAALHAAADAALRADEVAARPASWGGLLLRPDRIEFWQGSHDRLHRRLEYVHDGERWSSHRLQP